MKTIKIVKYPNRKRVALDVYDEDTNIHYTVAYFNKEENIDLFIEALTSHVYIRENGGNQNEV